MGWQSNLDHPDICPTNPRNPSCGSISRKKPA